MLPRILTRAVLLCCLVNAILVYGSPRHYSADQQVRSRRHASCPSCRQDCPGALSSPWYGKHVYEQPSRREYQRVQPETHPRWNKNYPIQTAQQVVPNLYDRYNRPSRSRGTVPSGNSATTSGDTCKRENPFDLREPKHIDPNLAPASSAPAYNPRSPVNPNPNPLQYSNYPSRKSVQNSPYSRPNLYDLVNQQTSPRIGGNIRHEHYNSEEEDSWQRNGKPDDSRKFYVVYRADENSEDSNEEEEPNGYAPEQFYRPRTSEMEHTRRPPPQEYRGTILQQPRRDRSYDLSDAIHAPEVQYNPYNLPTDLNVLKLLRGMQRQEFNNRDPWRGESSGSEEEGEELTEEFERVPFEFEIVGNNNEGRMRTVGEKNEETRGGFAAHDSKKNSKARSDDFNADNGDAIKIEKSGASGKKNETREESFSEVGRDLIEDTENPVVESTEATTKETSTVSR